MEYINNQEKLERVKFTNPEDYYIIADFDKTLTEGKSISTWGVVANSNKDNTEYHKRRNELYEYYRPIEIDSTISDEKKSEYMSEWWKRHVGLFFEYGLKEEFIKKSVAEHILLFRAGAKEFLSKMKEKNVPVIIVSAGIKNVIEEFLITEKCYFDNIYILSNLIKFKAGVIEKIEGETIHALNKNVIKLPQEILNKIEKRNNILLLGDGIADLKMVKKEDLIKTITVGFLDEKIEENLEHYNKAFDIVLTKEASFEEVNKILNIY